MHEPNNFLKYERLKWARNHKWYLIYNWNQNFKILNLNTELKIFTEINCNYVMKMWN
jgi:hypothetical protein